MDTYVRTHNDCKVCGVVADASQFAITVDARFAPAVIPHQISESRKNKSVQYELHLSDIHV